MKRYRRMLLLLFVLIFPGCGKGYPRSEIVFDAAYYLEGTENICFDFSKDSKLEIAQKGVYELTTDEKGTQLVRICLDDVNRELPEDYHYTEYRLREQKEYVELVYTSTEFDLDSTPMILIPMKGEHGLTSGEWFNGVYQIGEDGDSYQYVFEEDGTVTMRIEAHYYADKERMRLSDHAGDTEYLYECSEDRMTLKNTQEEMILNLIREQ